MLALAPEQVLPLEPEQLVQVPLVLMLGQNQDSVLEYTS
jgi:hypothetical protein